jgi:predicted CoA-binding protein
MNHDSYSDSYVRGILNTVKTIAMVGISPKDNRPSYFAFKYLLERGYRMIPVNPGQAGKEILGQKVYAKLADIPEPIDMVDVFRASQYAPGVVDEALELNPRPAVIWMQLGVRHDEAAAKAEAGGMKVNTRTITAKKARSVAGTVQRMALDRATMGGGTTDATERAQRAEAAAPADTKTGT